MRTKRKERSRKRSRGRSKKSQIKDPGFSGRIHKGTAASPNVIGYHYQKYSNIMDYLSKLVKLKNIGNMYIPSGNLLNNMINLDLTTHKIRPYILTTDKFKKLLSSGKKYRFCPLVLSVDLTDEGESDSHANIIILDNKKKNIELFEPHGYRTSSSELGDITAAYNKKQRILKKYFSKLLSGYTFIDVVNYVKKTAYQVLYDPDDHTGYCVTWSTLYAEYRILNPDVTCEELAKYIDKKITTKLLLKYSAKVEDILKNN